MEETVEEERREKEGSLGKATRGLDLLAVLGEYSEGFLYSAVQKGEFPLFK